MQSLDGFIAGHPGGRQLPAPREDLHRVFNDVMADTVAAVYGRHMCEIMRAWPTWDASPAASEVESALRPFKADTAGTIEVSG